MATALIFSTNIHADLTFIGMIPVSKTRKFDIEITIEKFSFLTFIKILLTSQQNQTPTHTFTKACLIKNLTRCKISGWDRSEIFINSLNVGSLRYRTNAF